MWTSLYNSFLFFIFFILALNKIIRHGQCCINVFGKTHFLTVSPLKKIDVENVQVSNGNNQSWQVIQQVNEPVALGCGLLNKQ